MLLKNSATNTERATIESGQMVARIDVACATHLLNQNYPFGPLKSFFNSIGQTRLSRQRAVTSTMDQKADEPWIGS
jgi:hypothetical protein